MVKREERLLGLFARARAGDAGAYHTFLAELAGHLRAFFRRRLARRPDDVEDLVQETLLAVHNQRHTYVAGEPLTPWLYAIARYKYVDALRRLSRDAARHDLLGDDADLLIAPEDATGENRRDLLALLQDLPDRQRLPILHVKIEGMSVVDTARLTGMSASAVKVGIHRGLKALARKWGGST